MNQIFRVIWNHSIQSWVAVSELTKSHKKASASNTVKTFLGATALLFSLSGVEAAVNIESTSGSNVNSGSTTASGNSIAIGSKANALGGDEIVIGRGAGRTENNGSLYGSDQTSSGFNISIGTNSRVGEKGKKVSQSVAIGGGNGSSENKPDGAWARGTQSVAIGGNAYAYGDSSIAIGGDDVDDAVKREITYTNPNNDQSKKATIKDAFTDLTGKNILSPRWTPTQASDAAVAVGMKATAAELSVSMGTLATASKVNAVAIGSGATAARDNSVALGGGSTTDKAGTKQTQTVVNGVTYSWAGGADTAEGDIVSVGSAGFERQIKNVAAGEVSNVSTDAINGSQLYGVLSNLTTGAFLNYAGDDADGKDKSDTTVIKQSIAENRLDIRGGADKAALTNENIGVNNENGKLWVKLAKDLKGLNSTTVGGIVTNASGIDMSNKPITNLAAGTNSTDAVNKSQLDKVATNNIKLGGDSGTTNAQQLDKTGGLQFNVKGTNGLTTTASGTDVTVKLDDATKAAVDSIANKIENNKIKLSATNDSTSTSEQDLNKAGGIEFKVKGENGLTASASGDTVTLKLDDATKAKVDSVDNKIGDNNISLGSNSGSTDTQALTNAGGMKFNIKGENGLTTTASGKDVTVKLDDTTKDKIDNAADKDLSNITPAGESKIKNLVTWKAKANNSGIDLDDDTVDTDDTAETIGADGVLTLDAGKNLRLQRKGKVFTYGLESNLTGINSIIGLANTLPVTKNDAAAPTTNQTAPTNVEGTKAASVNDILNAGWNLKENNTDKDFVKAYDTVNFVNGTGTTANVTVTDNGAVSAVKFDVKKTTITEDTAKPGTMKAGDAGDSFATANDVANAINGAFWNATSATTTNGEVSGTKVQPVKAGDTVTFEADKNIKLTQADGKFTFATKDDVEFNTVKVGGKEDGKSPVEFKTEKAKPASNNGDNNPTTALNVSSADGKPTQITGVASSLNKAPVTTAPNGKDGAKPESNLVDLANATTPNAVATVGDLQNMGWIVGAPENGYVDTVKNANKVDFKAGSGVSVTGKTVNGIREITIAVKEGEVVKDGDLTAIVNGESTPVTKVGDKYYKTSDIDPKTGKPVDEKVSPVTPDEGTTPIANAGDGYVTGNKVATAIQKSGFVVGKQTETLSDADFKNEDEKVNPNDELRFADGKNTKVKLATKDTVDREGNKVTTTTVKFDVDTGTVTSNKDGSVSGPVTPDMKKALDDAKKALADATTPEAKKTAQDKIDAVQANINNAGNQIATAQGVADAINKSGFTLTTSENGGKKLSGDDEIINPGKKVDLAAGKNMTVKQDAEGKVTYATEDEVNFSSVQFGDNDPKINAAGDNINIGDKDGNPTKITGVKAGDISPTSTDVVNGAQIYALSRGNVPNVKNITDAAGNTYNNVIVDENGTPILKTYNVQGQKEIITNSVVEAVHNMNEQGIKFFHSNDGVDRPKVETENTFDSSASGKFATAIGSRSKADGTNAVAIGFNSVVTGNDSISIGTGNRVTGNNSGAFGDPSTVSGQGSYSVGNNNTVSTNDTFVLGNEVKHTVENSVILGAKSTATAGDGSRTASLYNIKQDGTKGTSTTAGSVGTVTTATVGNMTYGGFQGAKANGVVSVGASGDERRIQNVAAGEISSTSTDAINGSQLYSVAKGMGNRINHLQGQVNKLGKRMNAGVAGAMAAANLMQPHKPGQSAAMAAVGQHRGEAALAVGYSRISDNGKYGIKLSMGADTQGQVSTGAGVSYFW